MLSASDCEFTETSVLDWRRDAEMLHSAVEELKGSSSRQTITQGAQQAVAAVSVLKELSELHELRGKLHDLPLTVEGTHGVSLFCARQAHSQRSATRNPNVTARVTRTQAQNRRSVSVAFLTDHPLPSCP